MQLTPTRRWAAPFCLLRYTLRPATFVCPPPPPPMLPVSTDNKPLPRRRPTCTCTCTCTCSLWTLRRPGQLIVDTVGVLQTPGDKIKESKYLQARRLPCTLGSAVKADKMCAGWDFRMYALV